MKCETPLRIYVRLLEYERHNMWNTIKNKYDYWHGKGMKCETPLRISMITGMKCETPLRISMITGMKCETPLRISMITGMGNAWNVKHQ